MLNMIYELVAWPEITIHSLNLERENIRKTIYLIEIDRKAYPRLADYSREIYGVKEKFQLHQYKYQKKKEEFALGRLAAKLSVSLMYQKENDLKNIQVTKGVFGQPHIRYRKEPETDISISHTGEKIYALAFPGGQQLAIDSEKMPIKEDLQHVILESCTSREISMLNSLGFPKEQSLLFIWTLKEALSKVLRCGLTVPFKMLEIVQPELNGPGLQCFFGNFEQYKGQAHIFDEYIFSIISPRYTRLSVPQLWTA